MNAAAAYAARCAPNEAARSATGHSSLCVPSPTRGITGFPWAWKVGHRFGGIGAGKPGAGAGNGGGTIPGESTAPTFIVVNTILIGTGSEVQHAVAAARELGPSTRVVSLPCFSRFERQPADYQETVLPSACERRVSIEAGVTFGWRAFVGSRGRMVGIDRYGASAPGNVVMDAFGMTQAAVVATARAL